jgi:hypothetical protein
MPQEEMRNGHACDRGLLALARYPHWYCYAVAELSHRQWCGAIDGVDHEFRGSLEDVHKLVLEQRAYVRCSRPNRNMHSLVERHDRHYKQYPIVMPDTRHHSQSVSQSVRMVVLAFSVEHTADGRCLTNVVEL